MIRAVKIIIISVIAILSLAGCVSREEKEKANVIIEENRQIIESYVDECLTGFKLNNIKMLYESAEFLSLLSTNNLEFEVIRDTDTDEKESESYKYIYCTDTNEIYTNYGIDEYKEDLVKKLSVSGVETTVGFNPSYITENITISQDYIHIGSLDDTGKFIAKESVTPLSSEYTLYLIFETPDNSKLIDIYDKIEGLNGLNYKIKILMGTEIKEGLIDRHIAKEIESQDSIFDAPASIIKLQSINGVITESIEKFEKIEADDFCVIYNPLKYSVSISESDDTLLGQSNLEESSKDYNISIESLNSSNDGTEFRVISNNYSGVIYACNNSHFTHTDNMNKKELFSLSTTYYKDIDVEDKCYSHSITIALYN